MVMAPQEERSSHELGPQIERRAHADGVEIRRQAGARGLPSGRVQLFEEALAGVQLGGGVAARRAWDGQLNGFAPVQTGDGSTERRARHTKRWTKARAVSATSRQP